MGKYCHCPSNYNCTVCNGEYECYRMDEKYICQKNYFDYSIIMLIICITSVYPISLLIKRIKSSCKKKNISDDKKNNIYIESEETIQTETGEESPPSYVNLCEKI
tara:strand:- start:3736 stop:4050 length:315 start_codon:yes stop_codon:yes gene_type:complete